MQFWLLISMNKLLRLCMRAHSLRQCPTFCDCMDYSPPGSSVHGDSAGKNTGVGCHALLQGIFLTEGSKLQLLHCRQILSTEPPGKPKTVHTGCCNHCLMKGGIGKLRVRALKQQQQLDSVSFSMIVQVEFKSFLNYVHSPA